MDLIRSLFFFLFVITVVSCQSNKKVKNIDNEDIKTFNSSIELGEALFFDRSLSLDSSISCASCHIPRLAFADHNALSNGVNNHTSMRNTPSILNMSESPTFMFDAHITSLEMQAIVPIQDTNEMGMKMGELIHRLSKNPNYSVAAKKLYNRNFDAWVLTRALADYERTLISKSSRFDDYYYNGNSSALTEEEVNGWKLFSEKVYCLECHQLPNFTNYKALNNGLYNEYGVDKGRFRIFGDSSDIGKFKVPSLRNIAITYPYMHDGSVGTLAEVIQHYAAGGKGHFNQDSRIVPFKLTQEEEKNLLLFFNTLTDENYINK